MKRLITNSKVLFATVLGLVAPQLINVSLAQPIDPPPPPAAASITGISVAVLILGCIAYGAYNIYKKNYKEKKEVNAA